jgi:hypothetical protein
MANQEHLKILRQGVEVWNKWRIEQPFLLIAPPNLIGANLSGLDLTGANLAEVYLHTSDLSKTNLSRVSLIGANLTGANLKGAILDETLLNMASLGGTNFSKARLIGADLTGANLTGANFMGASIVNCRVYAISAWKIQTKATIQSNLIITAYDEPTITVDNLEVAQFVYLLLNNENIRHVIDTITSKVVLILGRFTPKRKIVLDAIRNKLRERDYTPILFDFEKPTNRDITETVSTLAHMARFVIADLTDAKSIPQELMSIVPNLPSVPIQPLLLTSDREYCMFEHFTRYSWVLPVYRYTDEASLLQSLQEKVITPAEQKAQELAKR